MPVKCWNLVPTFVQTYWNLCVVKDINISSLSTRNPDVYTNSVKHDWQRSTPQNLRSGAGEGLYSIYALDALWRGTSRYLYIIPLQCLYQALCFSSLDVKKIRLPYLSAWACGKICLLGVCVLILVYLSAGKFRIQKHCIFHWKCWRRSLNTGILAAKTPIQDQGNPLLFASQLLNLIE